MMNSGDTQPLAPLHPHPTPLAPDRTEPRAAVPPRTRRRRAGRWAVSILLSLVLVAGGSIFGVMTLVYLQARTDEARPVDAIVVMGAAQYNGRPSPVFRARLEHTLAQYEQGLADVIVVTGGKQPGDQFTEAEVAAAWLEERGVPAGAIRLENAGRSTLESVEGVPAVLPPEDGASVLVVSDGFHLFRTEIMLRELGYEAYSSPAPDSPIRPWSPVEFGYVVRETGGVFSFLPRMWLG